MRPRSFQKIFIRQHDQSDCGVVCLASVAKYYGGEIALEKIRELSGTTQQGSTLLGLYQAAQQLGFDAQGLEAESVNSLKELKGPAILHIILNNQLQHYVVYYGFDQNNDIIIGDPARGVVIYSSDELANVWQSKTILKLIPNQTFIKVSKQRTLKKQWILDLVKNDINLLIAALFLGLIISALGLTTAIFSQKLIDNILPSGNTTKLLLSFSLVGILLLARAGLSYIRGFFLARQGMDFGNRIIQKFYGSILYLPKSFFDSRKTGDLIARMNDTRRIQVTISMVSGNILIDLLLILVAIGFVFSYSVLLGFVVICSLPVYGILLWIFNDKIIRSQKDVMGGYAFSESHYVDTIQGIATIKSANRETFFESRNKQVYGLFQEKVFDLGRLNLRFGLCNEIAGVTFIMLIFGLSSWMVLKDILQLGEMVALLSMAGSIIPSMNRLAIGNIQLQEAHVAFNRMFEFASLHSEIQDRKSDTTEAKDFNKIEIKNLSFRYPGKKQILKDISLSIKKGEMIALLGESGSGKSTLVQILQKFYETENGNILIDQENLKSISISSWRQQIGIVPQEVKIFNGTLLFNIVLSESEKDIRKSLEFCQQSGFSKFFEALPQGYMTIVGEGGINLSGGQKQLVAVVRALWRKPKFLLLDEPTSAMDKRTENFIMNLLLSLKSEMAVLLITHRIKTASYTDRIYILEEGTINNVGTPAELLTTTNFYSEAYNELITG